MQPIRKEAELLPPRRKGEQLNTVRKTIREDNRTLQRNKNSERLFPEGAHHQRPCTFHEWLDVCESTEHKYEYVDGRLLYLDMADIEHKIIQAYLCERVCVRAAQKASHLFGLLEVKISTGANGRIPDVVVSPVELLEQARSDPSRRGRQYLRARHRPYAVVEVTSNSTRNVDLNAKKFEYAAIGIKEYVIVDRFLKQVHICKLSGEVPRVASLPTGTANSRGPPAGSS